ncbi:protein transport protein S31 [Podila minutissima]|uniref:Protein transport protein SEC31 n=1 Tax=Podila minutissima TaxID=64525 RepID=A0A9P5VLZ9_9FUNG|nr:protein transport protein S31 [Podila minutissima]
MRQKTVSRTSTFAWSPGQHAPLLATGTVAGAFDANFSNTCQLEIFDLNLADKSPEAVEVSQPVGVVPSNARFNRLAWASPTVDRPYGMIAGGMENGELNLWDANAILSGGKDVLFSKQVNHSGPVRGLHFNPFQQNLLSSASSNGEVFIWDLGNMTKPYTPGTRSTKLDDITCVAWNNHVQHILATSSTTGYTVVWDLKSKREVLTLSYPGASVSGMGSMNNLAQMGAPSRRGITAIAWNPDVATQIITATEDDNSPVILVWDLRYAHAPEKLPPSSSWNFDIDWCPRNPDLLASASFDGKINVFSVQSTRDGDSALSSHAAQEAHDPFAPQVYQPQGTASTLSLKQPPKWLRRPVGASFGFGGKLAVFRNRPAPPLNLTPGSVAPAGTPANIPSVTLVNVITESEIVRRASDLEHALEAKALDQFCENQTHSKTDTAEYWAVLRALFEANPREQLVQHLGFNKQDLIDQVTALTGSLSLGSTSSLTSARAPISANGASGHVLPQSQRGSILGINALYSSSGLGLHSSESSTTIAPPVPLSASIKTKSLGSFHIYPSSGSDIDKKITRCVVAGDFDSAVNVCLHDNRLADALVLAICGGPELLERTQRAYFEKSAASKSYLRLLQSVVNGDLEDVVEHADLVDWQEVVVILCTFARPDEFGRLCEALGVRLESVWARQIQAGQTLESTVKLRHSTVLCYLAAGSLERVVSIWAMEQEAEVYASNGYDYSRSEYERNARSLQAFIEKVTVFRSAIDYIDPAISDHPSERHEDDQEHSQPKLATLYNKYTEYAEILSSQGQLAIALEYLNLTPAHYRERDTPAIMRDRVYHSGVDVSKVITPDFPFEPVYLVGEGEHKQQEHQEFDQYQFGQQQKHHQQQQQYQAPNSYAPQPVHHQPTQPQHFQSNYPAQTGFGAPPTQQYGQGTFGYQQQQQQQATAPPPPPPPQFKNEHPAVPQVTNNPYAPANPTFGGYGQTPSTFNQPPYGTPGIPSQSYSYQHQTAPPVERVSSAELPASQRKDTGNWNDPPMVPLANATKRPATAGAGAMNKAQITSPFPGGPVGAQDNSTPTPPTVGQNYYGQPPQPSILPPPPMGQRPPGHGGHPGHSRHPGHGGPSPQTGMTSPPRGPYQNYGNQQQQQQQNNPPPPPTQQQLQQQHYGQQQGYGHPSPDPSPYQQHQRFGSMGSVGGMASGMPQVVQQRPITPAAPPTPPQPIKSRRSAGDRTHIPEDQKQIYTVLSSELGLARQYATPAAKRPLDDAEKKLNVLFDMLNNEEASPVVVEQMLLLTQALQVKNYNAAYQTHLELHSTRTDEVSAWMTGVKRLIVDNARIQR